MPDKKPEECMEIVFKLKRKSVDIKRFVKGHQQKIEKGFKRTSIGIYPIGT